MKKAETEKLLISYELGQTSSKEEADLRIQLSDSKSGIGSWFMYLKSKTKPIPETLEQDIWLTIQKKKKKSALFRAIAAAASIALLISLFLISNPMPDKEMSYDEKAAVLEEALAMTSPKIELINRKILYEDEIIIIYNE